MNRDRQFSLAEIDVEFQEVNNYAAA